MSIQSVQRAFDILKIIDEARQPAGAALIATRANLPRTTVIRMLDTLEAVGAVSRIGDSNRFEIGPKAQLLGQPRTSHPKLKQLARPEMSRLAQETGETVYLCVPAGSQHLYLDQIDSQHHILLRNWVGQYFAHHTTAAGKLFLAHLPTKELDTYLQQPLQQFTEKTIIDPVAIRQYVEEIRRVGYAWTHEQTARGLIGVAAPIKTIKGDLVAALSLGGPAFRFPEAEREAVVAESVVEAARRIGEMI